MNIVYRNKIKETIDNLDTITYHITDKNFICYNDITYQRAIDIIEGPDMCRSEFTKKIKGLFNYGAGSQSIYSINFWIYRGWTLEESNLKVSDIQKNNSNKYVDKLKNGQIQRKQIPKKCDTLEKQQPSYDTGSLKYNITKYGEIEGVTKYKEISYKKGKSTRIEYYLEQGYSEDEPKKLLSERQATFSLEKCINKHGKEEGTRIFNERQEKWLNTLNSKPQEEIDHINSRKAITLDNMIRKWGEDGYKKILYMV